MLKAPRVAGAAQLRLFVDQIGFAASCEAVDVHPATMRKWLRDAAPVPRAALSALYWLTTWGFTDAAAEVHWSHQALLSKVRELERQLGQLDIAHTARVASNDAAAPLDVLELGSVE